MKTQIPRPILQQNRRQHLLPPRTLPLPPPSPLIHPLATPTINPIYHFRAILICSVVWFGVSLVIFYGTLRHFRPQSKPRLQRNISIEFGLISCANDSRFEGSLQSGMKETVLFEMVFLI